MTEPIPNQKLNLLLTREQIEQRVQQLGAEITRDFAGQSLVLLGVLKGAAIFLADLARAISLDCTFDFISAASYRGTESSGAVQVLQFLNQSIENRAVLLVEDVLDTGITLNHLKKFLLTQQPAMLKIAALLDKPSRRLQPIEGDYIGFTIPDHFVVGYGMDLCEQYRNLPDIHFVPPNI
jgi:hypoxanthine phosphoribosyltransferase